MGFLIDLVTAEGGFKLQINRFFLQIYNSFFQNLLLQHQHEDLTIIFADTEIYELETLKKSVLDKFILCVNFDLLQFKNRVVSAEETINATKLELKTDTVKLDKSNKYESQEMSVNSVNETEARPKAHRSDEHDLKKGELELRCPFADEDTEEIVTSNPNEIFAHILCEHDNLVENNHQKSFSRFMNHLQKAIEIKCYYKCDKTLRTKGELKSHYRLFHVEGEIICDLCGKTCKNKEKLKFHMKNSHYNMTLSFTCHLCGSEFPLKEKLNRHIKYVHEKENYKFKCDLCDKAFFSPLKLRQHHESVHEKSKPFVCDICGTKMSRFTNLSDHRFKLHGEKFPSIQFYRDLIDKNLHKFTEESKVCIL